MESFGTTLLQYLRDVLVTTSHQLLILFGPLLLLAFLMHHVSAYSARLGARVFGPNTFFYMFMGIGTAVHETGHAVFALIFGHRIKKIELFTADPGSESPGSVTHEYSSKNIYQNIGNFFIGIGPVIFGSLFLFMISYLLFGIGFRNLSIVSVSVEAFNDFSSAKAIGMAMFNSFGSYLQIVFTGERSTWWKVMLLIYLLYAVGSSISLSPSDISGSASGFVVFLAVLLVFNLATLWTGSFAINFFRFISSYFSGLYFLIMLSILVNMAFILLLLVPVKLFNRS
jgi:hypothetical protein